MLFESNKEKGRADLSKAIAWFGCNGYTVSIPLNDTQWYDFIAEKDGIFYTVQCKATDTKDNIVSLRSTGGTKGSVYDNVNNYPLDFLFCINKNCMWNIPVKAIKEYGIKTQITLMEKPHITGGKYFDTFQYLVQF